MFWYVDVVSFRDINIADLRAVAVVQNTSDLTFSNPFAKSDERQQTGGATSSRREAERQATAQLDKARVRITLIVSSITAPPPQKKKKKNKKKTKKTSEV